MGVGGGDVHGSSTTYSQLALCLPYGTVLEEGVGWDEVGRNGWGGGRCLRKFPNIMQLALSLHQNYSIYIKYRELFQSP